ncbi:MAG TPA: amidophosphoribosyltransferase [Bacteroidota bacterium]|nr:amidophosphoribosyltransferase [Bacteroidota bacterium]
MNRPRLDNDKPRCACGIFGIFGHPQASLLTYYGLHALQHRGQEASGIVALQFDPSKKKQHFNIVKGMGLVTDVFPDYKVVQEQLGGKAAIGHNRYSTAGSANNRLNIQPFTVNYRNGNLGLAHNGNLTNFHTLRKELQDQGTIFQTTSDSEIILHLIARSREKHQIDQIREALELVEGAFSLLILTDNGLIASRDVHGFRPLALGTKDGRYVVASETCAFDMIDAQYVRDIAPGEILVIDDEALESKKPKSHWLSRTGGTPHHCIFEYIYFSRPDSQIFGESVDKVRRKLGKALAQEAPIAPEKDDKHTIVISVPDSSNTATLGFVSESNKQGIPTKLEIGLIRNHYVGRTFIQPEQGDREMKVKTKYNTVKGVLKGKRIVLVDDSIVRGTTSKQLVKLLREAEPKEIHFRITSPPIVNPCHWGMDFPSREELIAVRCDEDVENIRKELGVDSVHYLSLDKMLEAVPQTEGRSYCTACFGGKYPTRVDSGTDKNGLES